MRKCNHIFVDIGDGTRDKFCVICKDKAMQAAINLKVQQNAMESPLAQKTESYSQPMMRETMTINVGGIGRVEVYRDELIAQINKGFKLMPPRFEKF